MSNDNDVIRLDQRVIVNQCGDAFCAEMQQLAVDAAGNASGYIGLNPRVGGFGHTVAEAFHNLKTQLPG